ncbi:hypothetical protein COCOBI_07-3800 [Coccomyxa sp. Obi]|nr:hypothetical protein COCOBI_07-3800 [Coccomyxa sp. Obi]
MLRRWKFTCSTNLTIFTAFALALIVLQGSFRPSLKGSQLPDNPPAKQGAALLSATLGISSRTEAGWPGQVKLLVWRAKHLASILRHSNIFQQSSEKRLSGCTKGSVSACKEQTGIQSLKCALCPWILLCAVFIASYQCLGLWRLDWQDESIKGAASLDYEAELFESRQELCRLQCELMAEKKARDNDVMNLRRWLDDAQGQLQNTQTALTLKEAEWKDILHAMQATENLCSVCQNIKELPLDGVQHMHAQHMHAMQSPQHERKCGVDRLACKDNHEKCTRVPRVSCPAKDPFHTLGQRKVLATGMHMLEKENMAPVCPCTDRMS